MMGMRGEPDTDRGCARGAAYTRVALAHVASARGIPPTPMGEGGGSRLGLTGSPKARLGTA